MGSHLLFFAWTSRGFKISRHTSAQLARGLKTLGSHLNMDSLEYGYYTYTVIFQAMSSDHALIGRWWTLMLNFGCSAKCYCCSFAFVNWWFNWWIMHWLGCLCMNGRWRVVFNLLQWLLLLMQRLFSSLCLLLPMTLKENLSSLSSDVCFLLDNALCNTKILKECFFSQRSF